MVDILLNPLNIIIIALGVSFLLPLIYQKSKYFAISLMMISLVIFVLISAVGYFRLLSGVPTLEILTSGIKPPFSINLRFGLEEALVITAINLAGLLGGWHLLDKLKNNVSLMLLFLIWIMGMNGMVMTRDLFNLFIFVEITAISTFVLVGYNQKPDTLSAGFKYIMAGALASSFLLLGTMLLYYQTGTLNIDDLIAHKTLISGAIGSAAIILVMAAILFELKPYPANGWGLDVYQASPMGISALISVGVSAAYLFALYKLLPLFDNLLPILIISGMLTFVVSNFIGLKQTSAARLLGYSSVGQVGLLIAAVALLNQLGESEQFMMIAGGLFINHFLAKAGLFWLAGQVEQKNVKDWFILKQKPLMFVVFITLLVALAGLPPFPGFWAKWQLILALAKHQQFLWIFFILLGSLLEAVYLFRWYGFAKIGTAETVVSKTEATETRTIEKKQTEKPEKKLEFNWQPSKSVPVIVFSLLLFICGHLIAEQLIQTDLMLSLLPVYVAMALLGIDAISLGAKIDSAMDRLKVIVSLVIIAAYSYQLIPSLTGISWLFGLIFLVGSGILILASFHQSNQSRPGYYPLLVMLVLSLGSLLSASTSLEFFLGWELMTLSSYLLVSLSTQSKKIALQYLIFSLAGAFFILTGFALAYAETGSIELSALTQLNEYSLAVILLLVIGFLIKLGGLGVHIWLPGVYVETYDDFTAVMSGIVSKAGVFGLFLIGSLLIKQFNNLESLMFLLGWFGLVMAFAGSLMAVFQEDVKRLLAYSSIGQIGYIITGFSLASHTGWVAAIYLTVNHVLYKGLIFLAIAGIILRLNTRLMYKMGGLIKNMPISFISVLIGIITISGVPPLLGFGGKWLIYNALLEKGWLLQAGLAFFASAIAFLYLFRLIHTIFLGQRKSEHAAIKEAPISLLIPQIILITIIMIFSMFPQVLVQPISEAVSPVIASTFVWTGSLLETGQGYWNGYLIMNIITGVFLLPLFLLWMFSRGVKLQKVKQFNIVFAAERPESPESTHFAFDFYSFYRKALGFLIKPKAIQFWNSSAEWSHTFGSALRRIYTGNGQTYIAIILMYLGILYLTVRVF